MADATEDLLTQARPASPTTSSPFASAVLQTASRDVESSDDDDLPPDFLNLARTTKDKKSKTGAPPKRGTKDFESNRTLLQSRTLEASRNAMWDALGVVRVHHASAVPVVKKKKRQAKVTTTKLEQPVEAKVDEVAGQGDDLPQQQEEPEEEEDEREQETSTTTINPSGTPIGIYNPTTNLTYIAPQHRRGKLFDTIGCDLSGGGVELLPEEALWALEGSKLDVRYPDDFWEDAAAESGGPNDGLGGTQREALEPSMPMPLQGAYAAYIGGREDLSDSEQATPSASASASHDKSHTRPARTLTQEKYAVYAALKRLGYIVLRAKEWNDRKRGQEGDKNEPFTPQTLSRTSTFEAELEAAEAESRSGHTSTIHSSSSSGGSGTSHHNLPSSTSGTSSFFPLTLWHWLTSLIPPFPNTTETTPQQHARQRLGPLIPPGTYRQYPHLYPYLNLIPYTNPLLPTPPTPPRIVVSIHGERASETAADRSQHEKERREGSGRQAVRFLPKVKTYLVDGSRPTSQEREEAVVDEGDVKTPVSERGGGVLGEGVNFDAAAIGGGDGSATDVKGTAASGPSTKDTLRRKKKQEENPYITVWDVYKPPGNRVKAESDPSDKKAASWKKSSPGPPNFRICVVSARDSVVPTLSQMEALFGEQRVERPPRFQSKNNPNTDKGAGTAEKKAPEPINALYTRLRHGYRNVILAIVDEGVVSYVRMGDAGFGREKLYERVGYEGGGKGGGRGGGRGRGGRGGRGRGR